MIEIDGKEYRNLMEQVGKNQKDIKNIKQAMGGALPDPIEGPEGPQGVSVVNADVNADNELIVSLSDGTTINAGTIKTLQGPRGYKGEQGPVGKTILDLTKIDAKDYTPTTDPSIGIGQIYTMYTSADVYFGDIKKTIDFEIKYKIPKPDEDPIGSTLALRDGNGAVHVITIESISTSAVNVDFLKARTSAPNLIINPNFRINQRGKTTYTYTGIDDYTVDRWGLGTANGTLEYYANACLFYSLDGQNATLVQPYEGDLTALDVALSCNISDIKGQSSGVIYNNTNEQLKITTEDFDLFIQQTAVGSKQFNIVIRTKNDRDHGLYLYWTKLESRDEITKSTPFSPPNLAEELIKCKRYYKEYMGGTNLAEITTNTIYFRLPNQYDDMRVIPSVSFKNSNFNVVDQLYITSGNNTLNSGWTFNVYTNGVYKTIQFKCDKNNHGLTYANIFIGYNAVVLNAEIPIQ